MSESDQHKAEREIPPIYVVSGGKGSIAEEVVRSALAQFEGIEVPVIVVPRVRHQQQIDELMPHVAASQGTIVHTMMDAEIRKALIQAADAHQITSIDLVGHLLERLSQILGQQPLGRPGWYHHLRASYYERIEAIEFTVAHDDGRNPHEWHKAEIVLTGVSRTGKTPLSIYLSVQGWKVANVPLVRELPPPPELFQIDPRRVIGLTIDGGQLAAHRQKRQKRLGIALGANYTDLDEVYQEVAAVRRIFRKGGFAVVDVTDKPIEESADEVINIITRQNPSRL